MARNAAYIRDNPTATGDCDWQDITNNWRDADATWLQERSIVRVTTTPDAETQLVNTSVGRLFYSVTNELIYVSTTGGAPFPHLLASTALVVDESAPGVVKVGISGHEAPGISFDTATGDVTIGNLTISALSGITMEILSSLVATEVAVGAGGLSIETDGVTTVSFETDDVLGLVIDTDIAVMGEMQSATAVVGALTSGATDLGPSTVSTTLTVGTSVTTPAVHAHTSEDLTVSIQSGKALRFTAPTLGDANFFYGAGSAIRLAWIVVNSVDPGVTNVPEGTIWIQP